MKIESIKIDYYKSLGEQDNILKVDDAVTVIIGKNESGKSNILDAVTGLSFFSKQLPQFAGGLKVNRLFDGKAVSVTIHAQFLPSESNITTKSVFTVTNAGLTYTGGISEYYAANSTISNFIAYIENDLIPLVPQNNNNPQYVKWLKDRSAELKAFKNKAVRYELLVELDSAKNYVALPEDKQKPHDELIESVKKELITFFGFFPRFCFYSGEELKSKYGQAEIEKEMNNVNSKFYKLFTHLGITKAELLSTIQQTNPMVKTKREAVAQKFEQGIVQPFLQFYTQEQMKFYLDFEYGSFDIGLNAGDANFSLSERSNGLRWYFNLFVSLLTEGATGKNIVLLIDEPGASLHIDAQAELLNCFENLSSHGKQIIFTTHSPFMIDTTKLSRIRLVEKIENMTRIRNKHNSDHLDGATRRETLSPLMKAMGASFSNLSPDLNQLNIITEGIIDRHYIKAMLRHLGVAAENEPFIIPCVGVSNENTIATILLGWGCQFKCLIDYDKAGFAEYKNLSKLDIDDSIVTVNTKAINETEMKDANTSETIESLLSVEDRLKFIVTDSLLSQVLNGKGILTKDEKAQLDGEKSIMAAAFYEQVTKGQVQLTTTTIENFKRLFVALGIMR